MIVIEVIPSAAKLCIIQKTLGKALPRGTIRFFFFPWSKCVSYSERAATLLPSIVLFAAVVVASFLPFGIVLCICCGLGKASLSPPQRFYPTLQFLKCVEGVEVFERRGKLEVCTSHQSRIKASMWWKCFIKWPASYRVLNRCLGLGNVHTQGSRKNWAGCTVWKRAGERGRKICVVSRAAA